MVDFKSMGRDQLRDWLTSPGEALGELEGVSKWDPGNLTRGFDAAKELDPGPRGRSTASLGQIKTESRKLLGQTKKAARQGEQLGFDTGDLKGAIKDAKVPKEQEPSALDKYFLGPLDAPAHVLRAATTPGGSWFDWKESKDSGEWNKLIERKARAGHTGAKIQQGVKDVIGATAGSLVGGALAVPGLVSDVARGHSGASIAREAGNTFRRGQKATGEFGLTALTDPLAYLPVGKLAKAGGRLALEGAEKVPALAKAGRAFIGAGDLPLVEGLAKKAEFGDIARHTRGVRDLTTDQYIHGGGLLPGEIGPKQAITSVESAEDLIRRGDLVGADAAKRYAKAKFLESAKVGTLDELPPAAAKALDRATNPDFQTLSKWLGAQGMHNPVLSGAAKLYETAVGAIKTNVLSRSPAHHVVNVFNDTLQMFMGGVNNPARIHEAIDLLHGKGTIQVGNSLLDSATFKELMQREGLLGGGLQRMGFIGEEGRKAAAMNLAKEAGVPVYKSKGSLLKGLATGGIADIGPAKLPINAKFGEGWTDIARAAMFIDRLKKGDAVNQAARTTLHYLLDYKDVSKPVQVARWFVPFINWYMKAPAMVARAALEHPARLLAPERLARSLGGEQRVEQPEFRAKAGTNIPLSARGEDIMSSFRGAPAEGQTYLRTRLPATEAMSAIAELLQGNTTPLSEQAGPLPQALLASLGKDPITGGEIPRGLASGLKYGLSTAVPSALFSRPMQSLVVNPALSAAIGEGAPARPLSPFRNPSYDPTLDRARDIGSMLGVGTFTAKPEDRAREELNKLRDLVETYTPKIKRAKKVAAATKKK